MGEQPMDNAGAIDVGARAMDAAEQLEEQQSNIWHVVLISHCTVHAPNPPVP